MRFKVYGVELRYVTNRVPIPGTESLWEAVVGSGQEEVLRFRSGGGDGEEEEELILEVEAPFVRLIIHGVCQVRETAVGGPSDMDKSGEGEPELVPLSQRVREEEDVPKIRLTSK